MIYIGYQNTEKLVEVVKYKQHNDVNKVVVISADKFPLLVPEADQVTYSDSIEYITFYRLLQQVDKHTLIVLNECLRTQNRYDLTYNCIRLFLNQTKHQLIFQHLPLIDTRNDFMVLFDWDTRSRWKRRKFDIDLVLSNSKVVVNHLPLMLSKIVVPTPDKVKKKYTKEKEKRFAEIGNRDPHTIPRNLHLIGGKAKRDYIDTLEGPKLYVARNQRLKRDCITTYKLVERGKNYVLVDFPHRFIDMSDFIQVTWQNNLEILLVDLKVDHWYFERYSKWIERYNELCTSLQQ